MKNKGFTLIELLLVISIISLLSSIILASINTARVRAQAVHTISSFQQVEKALYMMALDQGRGLWWSDDRDTSGASTEDVLCDGRIPGSNKTIGVDAGNPRVGKLVESVEFSEFFPSGIESQVGDFVRYDNDCEVTVADGFDPDGDGCDTDARAGRGVNIQLTNLTNLDVFDYIDTVIDGGDGLLCGKVRFKSDGAVYYMISKTANIE
jgi:prepilin-type N-terminal cleavage/methylation domain-containing protein